MKFNIYLKDKNAKSTSLLFKVSYNNEVFKYNSKIKVEPIFWDRKRQILKSNHPDHFKLSNIISESFKSFKTNLYDLYKDYPYSSLNQLKIIFKKKLLNNSNETNFEGLVKLIDEYYNYLDEFRSKNSLRSINTLKNHLIKLNEIYPLSIENIDTNFVDEFQKYFISLGNTNNTCNNNLKHLKTILNWGFEREKFKATNYQSINGIYKNYDPGDKFSLTITDLQKLIDLDLENNRKLNKVRDLFLIMCLTGQRFNDYKSFFNSKHFIDNNWVFIQSKTKRKISIPLSNVVIKILEKYDYSIPIISDQKSREYLKEIANMAGFDETITKEIRIGNISNLITLKKYDAIALHTSRRTFLTLAENLGISGEMAKSIAGISENKTHKIYLRFESEQIKKSIEIIGNNLELN